MLKKSKKLCLAKIVINLNVLFLKSVEIAKFFNLGDNARDKFGGILLSLV